MTLETAIKILIELGWNQYSAEAIVDQLIEDNLLETLTEKRLIQISDDYKDR